MTAHPAEPATAVVLRAGEVVLESYLDEPGAPLVGADPLRELFARHLGERLPDDAAGRLYAAVTAAAVIAALDLALDEWRAAGARAEGAPACRERFRTVAALLPPPPDDRTFLRTPRRPQGSMRPLSGPPGGHKDP